MFSIVQNKSISSWHHSWRSGEGDVMDVYNIAYTHIYIMALKSPETPSVVGPQLNILYWGSKWNEVWLAVSGGQPLFTLGLLMFALSLVDFLFLLWSPSTNIEIFYFCQKYHLKHIYKIFKNSRWFKI